MSLTDKFDNVSVSTRASVYFDGKCVSHTIVLADGSRKSVGVILPATLTFTTGAPECMEGVAGSCCVRLNGETGWKDYGAGDTFSVAGDSGFDIEVVGEPYHYICHFG